MNKSTLIPFIRENLDILFVGLNPAKGSSENGHYFSVNQSFWNQLLDSGLITKNIDKSIADDIVFGSTIFNYENWDYGMTDLMTEFAESDSKKIKPTIEDCKRLKETIKELKPSTVVILHSKVLREFLKYLEIKPIASNTGKVGRLIKNCDTTFFNIAFPHGNAITNESKIERYIELKEFLEIIKKKSNE